MIDERVYVKHVDKLVRLGVSAPSPNPKVQLEAYLDEQQALPRLRRTVSNAQGLDDFLMCGNDRLGDCTCAAVEHALHILRWQDRKGVDEPEDEQRPIDLYWATGSEDTGRVISNVLGYVRQHGYGGNPKAILGYLGVDTSNIAHVAAAIDLLGGLDIGVALPVTAQSQQHTWDVVGNPDTDPDSAPGSWGGHSIWVQAYNHLSTDNNKVTSLVGITWGKRIWITQRFWDAYVYQGFGIVSSAWLNKTGDSPQGFNLAQLESDLHAIGS